MTDKEFKELWDFAEKQNVLVKVLSYPYIDYNPECFAIGEMKFCKDGNIRCCNCDEILIENRTAKQMKAIIENLL